MPERSKRSADATSRERAREEGKAIQSKICESEPSKAGRDYAKRAEWAILTAQETEPDPKLVAEATFETNSTASSETEAKRGGDNVHSRSEPRGWHDPNAAHRSRSEPDGRPKPKPNPK